MPKTAKNDGKSMDILGFMGKSAMNGHFQIWYVYQRVIGGFIQQVAMKNVGKFWAFLASDG